MRVSAKQSEGAGGEGLSEAIGGAGGGNKNLLTLPVQYLLVFENIVVLS